MGKLPTVAPAGRKPAFDEVELMDSKRAGPASRSRASVAPLPGPADATQACTTVARSSSKELQKPSCVLDPESYWMRKWDNFIVVLLIYTAFVTPYEVGFLGEPKLDPLFIINRCADCGFIIDMVFQFFLGYHDEVSNFMVYDHGMIARRYLNTWFITDFFSVIPFDALGFFAKSAGKAEAAKSFEELKLLRLLKLKRLVKLLRLIRSARILKRWQAQLDYSFLAFSLMKFGVALVVLLHWLACAWAAGIAIIETEEMAADSWVHKLGLQGQDVGTWEKYVACIEFAMMAMVFGYGQIAPAGTGEKILALSLLAFGGSVYVYMIGAICGAVSNVDPASTDFKQSMDLLRLHMHEVACPPEMCLRFRKYMMRSQEIFRHAFYQDVVARLSPGLRGQLAVFTYTEWMSKVPFFHCHDERERERFVVAVAPLLRQCSYTKFEVVCRVHEPAQAMFILQSGVVGAGGAVRRKGEWFGEEVLINEGVSACTCIAMTFIETMMLGREDLVGLLGDDSFPETKKLIRKTAFKMVLRAFVRKVGIAHRMQTNSRRMTRAELERWRAKQRRRAQLIKERQQIQPDYMSVVPRSKEEIAIGLPEGVEFSEEQRQVLEKNHEEMLDLALDKAHLSAQGAITARLEQLEIKLGREADVRRQRTEALEAQVEQLGGSMEAGFAQINAQMEALAAALAAQRR